MKNANVLEIVIATGITINHKCVLVGIRIQRECIL